MWICPWLLSGLRFHPHSNYWDKVWIFFCPSVKFAKWDPTNLLENTCNESVRIHRVRDMKLCVFVMFNSIKFVKWNCVCVKWALNFEFCANHKTTIENVLKIYQGQKLLRLKISCCWFIKLFSFYWENSKTRRSLNLYGLGRGRGRGGGVFFSPIGLDSKSSQVELFRNYFYWYYYYD
jgi:hypothetical protein